MQRQIGVGVIGLGRLAADVSAARRAHAQLVGVERTVEDWRAAVGDPAVDVVSITLPQRPR